MEDYMTGTWEEFEVWIRETIGGNFRWNVRSMDNPSNRAMIGRPFLLFECDSQSTTLIFSS